MAGHISLAVVEVSQNCGKRLPAAIDPLPRTYTEVAAGALLDISGVLADIGFRYYDSTVWENA